MELYARAWRWKEKGLGTQVVVPMRLFTSAGVKGLTHLRGHALPATPWGARPKPAGSLVSALAHVWQPQGRKQGGHKMCGTPQGISFHWSYLEAGL